MSEALSDTAISTADLEESLDIEDEEMGTPEMSVRLSVPDTAKSSPSWTKMERLENHNQQRTSKTADHIFDKIFHTPPSAHLALKLYGRIVPGNPHKQRLQPGDSKWMIHPYSHFK